MSRSTTNARLDSGQLTALTTTIPTGLERSDAIRLPAVERRNPSATRLSNLVGAEVDVPYASGLETVKILGSTRADGRTPVASGPENRVTGDYLFFGPEGRTNPAQPLVGPIVESRRSLGVPKLNAMFVAYTPEPAPQESTPQPAPAQARSFGERLGDHLNEPTVILFSDGKEVRSLAVTMKSHEVAADGTISITFSDGPVDISAATRQKALTLTAPKRTDVVKPLEGVGRDGITISKDGVVVGLEGSWKPVAAANAELATPIMERLEQLKNDVGFPAQAVTVYRIGANRYEIELAEIVRAGASSDRHSFVAGTVVALGAEQATEYREIVAKMFGVEPNKVSLSTRVQGFSDVMERSNGKEIIARSGVTNTEVVGILGVNAD